MNLKRFLTAVLLPTISILALLYQTYSQYLIPRPELELSAGTDYYRMPPTLDGVLTRKLTPDNENSVNTYYKYVFHEMNINQFTFATLKNNGDKEASHIVIRFPGAKQIRQSDADHRVIKIVSDRPEIEIDKLLPNQRFYLSVWSESKDEEEALEISAAHSEGRIKLRLDKKYDEDYVSNLKFQNILALVMMLVMLVAMVWLAATSRDDS